MSLRCNECSNRTNCRVGISNRDIQPIKFSCRNCGTIIGIRIGAKNIENLDLKVITSLLQDKNEGFSYSDHGLSIRIENATKVHDESIFASNVDFVDLHLDFPVVFGPYIPGNTPFMQAIRRAGGEMAIFHRDRLGIINAQYKKYPQVVELIAKYTKELYGPFSKYIEKHFDVSVTSRKIEDINAALYTVLSRYVLPFTLPDDSAGLVRKFTATLSDLIRNNEVATSAFLQQLYDTKYIANLQRDCLKVYKAVFEAELPLRPALFLDVDVEYVAGITAMRVSSQDFVEYREIYKDMAEVLGRQLVLVAGVGNLVQRGDHNLFATRTSKNGKLLSPASLNSYADIPLGKKLEDIDGGWHRIDPMSHDNELRNAIAHNKIDYNDLTQMITYFPKLEGMEQEKKMEMYLIEYMHRLLALFREVHRLHHLVKCINYAMLLEPGAIQLKRN